MSAALDYLAGGADLYGGDWGGELVGNDVPQASSPANTGSGYLQNLAALGTGYLSRRADIDLQGRAIAAGIVPSIRTTQPPVSIRRSQTGSGTILDVQGLMPLLLVGLAVWFIASRA